MTFKKNVVYVSVLSTISVYAIDTIYTSQHFTGQEINQHINQEIKKNNIPVTPTTKIAIDTVTQKIVPSRLCFGRITGISVCLASSLGYFYGIQSSEFDITYKGCFSVVG